MPLLTAAPLPLLYGCRMTRAPAAAACAPVSSVEPSSTTRISSQGAAAARSRTTTPIESASLNAGMTTDVRAAFEASAIVLGRPQHEPHRTPRRRATPIPCGPSDDGRLKGEN